jgi:hypothetical protein
MESDPFSEPPGSSPPNIDPPDLELPDRAPSHSPSLPIPPITNFNPPRFDWSPSSDPLGGSSFENTLSTNTAYLDRLQPQSRIQQSRKRGQSTIQEPPTKEARRQPPTSQPTSASQDLVLQARDLLVSAYSASNSRAEQTQLLDLLGVFREYTESGLVRKTTSLLATQIANLEQTSRKIELQAKTNQSWAKVAAITPTTSVAQKSYLSSNQDWTLVTSKKGSSTGTSKNTSPSTREKTSPRASGPGKPALSKRCTLLQAHRVQASSFSSIRTRDLINKAFQANGIQKLVVSIALLSIKGNIVIVTTPDFNSDFLLENLAIIKGVLPLTIGLQKGEPWYKVIIHGLPIKDFNTIDGMDLVLSEIKTFNKGLEPVGKPYWLIPKERQSSDLVRTGSVVVSFPTEAQAIKAIKSRLIIAGISAKVVKYRSYSSTTQCLNCCGFGYTSQFCKKDPKCLLCASPHTYKEHFCAICKKKGQQCTYLTPKCTNCTSTTHSANSKLCEVYLALKNRPSASTTTDPTPIIINE